MGFKQFNKVSERIRKTRQFWTFFNNIQNLYSTTDLIELKSAGFFIKPSNYTDVKTRFQTEFSYLAEITYMSISPTILQFFVFSQIAKMESTENFLLRPLNSQFVVSFNILDIPLWRTIILKISLKRNHKRNCQRKYCKFI